MMSRAAADCCRGPRQRNGKRQRRTAPANVRPHRHSFVFSLSGSYQYSNPCRLRSPREPRITRRVTSLVMLQREYARALRPEVTTVSARMTNRPRRLSAAINNHLPWHNNSHRNRPPFERRCVRKTDRLHSEKSATSDRWASPTDHVSRHHQGSHPSNRGTQPPPTAPARTLRKAD